MEYLDPEIEDLLRENIKVSKENNELLHKIWSDVKYKRVLKFLYWAILIALTLGAYYYIQPIVEGITGSYGSIKGGIDAGIENIQKLNNIIPRL